MDASSISALMGLLIHKANRPPPFCGCVSSNSKLIKGGVVVVVGPPLFGLYPNGLYPNGLSLNGLQGQLDYPQLDYL